MMKTDKILVVPDVHGRAFWKVVKEPRFNDYEIVFLGDYLDPYTNPEGITQTEAFDNFLEIIEFAKNNSNRVHLLIGNHDAQYLSLSDSLSRSDYTRRKEIFKIFSDNRDMFNIAYKWNNTLFTHAGVSTKWISQNEDLSTINKDNVDTVLNDMLHRVEWVAPERGYFGLRTFVNTPLGDIGRSRGGYSPYGSCIWADAEEMFYHSAFYDIENVDSSDNKDIKLKIDLYQITGHTRLVDEKIIIHPETNWWMCDSRWCFMWDESKEELFPVELIS